VNALGMLIGSTVLMAPVAFAAEGVPSLSYTIPVWTALVCLAVASTALAYLLYFTILTRAGAANLMLVTLMIPPFAATLGALFLDERLSPNAYVGFVLIGIGLLITDGRILRYLKPT